MAEKYKDTRYRNAKSEGKKITKLYDGNGLFLWVYEDGRKYWRLRYRIHGKKKSILLGVYPDVSLSEAREKAKLECKKVEDHIDPSIDRKVTKQRTKQAAENSFEAVSREWYAKQDSYLGTQSRQRREAQA